MANENKDVLRVCNTEANLAIILRDQQFGFATDTKRLVAKYGGALYKAAGVTDNGFILNQGSVQAGATFNIGGSGTIGGTLTVMGAASTQTLSTGAAIFSGDVTMATQLEVAGDVELSGSSPIIRLDTADGSDSKIFSLTGGGAASDTRGSHINLRGNEYATTGGRLDIVAGNMPTGIITFSAGGTERARFQNNGRLLLNTTTDDSVSQLQVQGSPHFWGPSGAVLQLTNTTASATADATLASILFGKTVTNGMRAGIKAAYATTGYTATNNVGLHLDFFTSADGAGDGTRRLRITDSGSVLVLGGFLGVNATAPATSGYTTSTFSVLAVKGAAQRGVLELIYGSADAAGATVGSIDYVMPLNNGEKRIGFISCQTAGAVANERGGALLFITRSSGASGALLEAMRVTETQRILMGTTTDDGTNRLQVSGNAKANQFVSDRPAGQTRGLFITTSSSNRWLVGGNSDVEGGSNAGTDFVLSRYSDAGAFISSPLIVRRSDGRVSMADGLLRLAHGSTNRLEFAGDASLQVSIGEGGAGVLDITAISSISLNAGSSQIMSLSDSPVPTVSASSTNFDVAEMDADMYRVLGTQVVYQRKTGWALPTGTSKRTTWDTATITHADLAQVVKALIEDLHATAGHGLIGT